MKFRGGEFSTGTTGNFQPELTRTHFHIRDKQCRVKCVIRIPKLLPAFQRVGRGKWLAS